MDDGPLSPADVRLRLTGRQHDRLQSHLYPGDGKETVALALCGVARSGRRGAEGTVVCVHRIEPVPIEACRERTPDRVTWDTEGLPQLLAEAGSRGQALLKIHSHPSGFAGFSRWDDKADRELFSGAAGWLDTSFPGVSAVMLPDGRVFARSVSPAGDFAPVRRVVVAGPDIHIWDHGGERSDEIKLLDDRTAQMFGKRTTRLLSRLSVGVVGCSGTGSPVVEQLYRLGVGEVVLVDPEPIGGENVRRIYNSTLTDVAEERPKVDILAQAIERSDLPTGVVTRDKDLFNADIVRRLARCDILMGCMDSVDGRHLLNRLAVYYSIPYVDVGVRIDADGEGGVDQVSGAVHYLQPDGSSLGSRGVYTPKQLRAASLRREDPEAYREEVEEGYIRGVQEDRPAVISVNTLGASLAINDLLARLHPFRDEPNHRFATIRFSVTQTRLVPEPEGEPCPELANKAGRGDVRPLLDSPALSTRSR